MIPRQLDLVPAISRPSFISSAPTRPVQPPTAVRRTHYALCSTSDDGSSSTYRLFTVEASVVPPMELRQITQTEAQSAATHDDGVDDDERHSENGGADSIKAVAPTTTMAAQGRRRRPRSQSSRQFFVSPSSGAQFAAVAVQEFEPLACIIVRTTTSSTTTTSSSSVSADASHTMLCATRVASMPLAELHPMEVRHDDDESVPEQWRSLASARSRRALRQEWRTMDELDQVSGGSRWEMEEAEVETHERNAKVPRREVAEEVRASTRTTTSKSATTTATTSTNQKHGDTTTTTTTTASTHTPATHTTKDVVAAEDMSLDAIATKVIADLVAHDKTEASTKELDKIILKQLPTFSAVAEKMKVPHTRAEAMSWFREMQAALRSWLEEQCYDVDPAGVVHFGG